MVILWIFTKDYNPKQLVRHIRFECKDRTEADKISKDYIGAIDVWIEGDIPPDPKRST
jgi:hypothetical protein